jgi:hypothetical protein
MTGETFAGLVRAEWIKLRSVRRWSLALLAAVVLTVGLSLLAAAGGATDTNQHRNFVTGPDGQPVADEFEFVQQPLDGDGTLTLRVASLAAAEVRGDAAGTVPGAAAGIMIKESLTSGSRYVAVEVTAGRGVRMEANFHPVGDRDGAAPGWLRLTRAGHTVTGYASADGVTWHEVGRITDAGLPDAARIGFFVSSPPQNPVTRGFGGVSVGENPTHAVAVFDNVSAPPSSWRATTVRMVLPDGDRVIQDAPRDPNQGGDKGRGGAPRGMTETAGAYTVDGSGEIGPKDPPDDIVQIGLYGVIIGLLTILPVAVLYITSEYRRNLIHATLAATPRRGRVLAAKALVLGAVTFVLGLVAATVSVTVTQPVLRAHGFAPPGFPRMPVTDGRVALAVVLTAAFMAAIALFGLGVGTVLRRGAAAVTTAIVLVLVPAVVGLMLPGRIGIWLVRFTPAAGLATQRVKPPTDWLSEPWSAIHPWVGLATVCAYAAVSLLAGWWLLRRRDS